MKILKAEIQGFGKIQNKTISFTPGLQLITGKNEAGKSTVHAFIRAMLFGLERGRGRVAKDDRYVKYLPWESGAAYGGSLDFELDGKTYRILRDFHKNTKSTSCICLDTGREVILPSGRITDLIPHFTESLYRNTVSVEQQKAQTDEELAEQVRNYVANLSATGIGEVNIKQALADLTEERKQAENRVKETDVKLQRLTDDIARGKAEKVLATELRKKRQELLEEQSGLEQRVRAIEGEAKKEFQERMAKVGAVNDKMEKDLAEMDRLIAESGKIEKRRKEIEQAKEEQEEYMLAAAKRKSLFVAAIGGLIALVCFAVRPDLSWGKGILAGLALSACSGLWYLLTMRSIRRRPPLHEQEELDMCDRMAKIKEKYVSILDANAVLNIQSLRGRYESARRDEYMDRLHAPSRGYGKGSEEKAEPYRKQAEAKGRSIAKLEWEIEGLEEGENRLAENRNKKMQMEELREMQLEDVQAVRLAISTVERLSAELHDDFGGTFTEEISKAVSRYTGGAHKKVFLDEKLNLQISEGAAFVPVRTLSVGAMEQVYLALRLACADALTEREDIPLLLDDSFAYYDEERLEAVLRELVRLTGQEEPQKDSETSQNPETQEGSELSQNPGRQVLLFTCQEREKAVLERMGSKYHLIEL